MSKRRAKWFGYVRQVLYDYPRLSHELSLRKAAMQSTGYHAGSSSGAGRPAEVLALATLPDPQEQRELEAVEAALAEADDTARQVAELVFFRRSHTLQGASMALYISYATAKRRSEWLMHRVAANLGIG